MKFRYCSLNLETLFVGLIEEMLRVKSLVGKALATYQIPQNFSTLKLWYFT